MSVKKNLTYLNYLIDKTIEVNKGIHPMELSDSLHGKQDKEDCVPAQHTILCWKPSE